jgi:hypothetical protein
VKTPIQFDSAQSWAQFATQLHTQLWDVQLGAGEIQQAIVFAAAKARSGDPWPGEMDATIQALDVMNA